MSISSRVAILLSDMFPSHYLSIGPIPIHPKLVILGFNLERKRQSAPRASAARCRGAGVSIHILLYHFLPSVTVTTAAQDNAEHNAHCETEELSPPRTNFGEEMLTCADGPFRMRTLSCEPPGVEAAAGACGATSRTPRTSPVSSDAETFMSTGVKAVPSGTRAASNHFLSHLRKMS